MLKKIAILLVVFVLSGLIQACSAPAAARSDGADPRMDWWREARFGMFIHWGLYAIPAGNWGTQTTHGEWILDTAHIPVETYEKFTSQFNPVKFDARAWARMAKNAGMKYMVITSKHHDGFCLFDSKYTDYDVMSTPFGRDILKELQEACEQEGIRLCFYHSIMDWHHPDYLPRRPWETRSSAGAVFDRYVNHLRNQVGELLTNYGKIGVLWFDGEWEATWTHALGIDLYNYCRSMAPWIIVNNRVDKGRGGMAGMTSGGFVGDFGTPEQEIPATGLPGVDWETCMTMNRNWGYNSNDRDFKSRRELIQKLSDIASKGGNFLLNIGPRADGTFPEESVERLAQMGAWMDAYGPAVHGTSAGPFPSLPFGRCTQKREGSNTTLYFHVFDWPGNGQLNIGGLGNDIVGAGVLAGPGGRSLDRPLTFEQKNGSVTLSGLPPTAPDADCSVVRVTVKGTPIVYESPTFDMSPAEFVNTTNVAFVTKSHDLAVRYTLDGTDPAADSLRYERPWAIRETTRVRAATFHGSMRVSGVTEKIFTKVAPWPAKAMKETAPGLRYDVIHGKFTKIPSFDGAAPAASGVSAGGVVLPKEAQREHAAVRWNGWLTIEKTDMIHLRITSDDGSRLKVDGRVVIDHDGLHSTSAADGFAPLLEGKHWIEVEWFNREGGGEISIELAPIGAPPEPIPAALFGHEK